MATPTYTLISEQVLGSSASSVTFSSIPSTYKDLVLELVPTAVSNPSAVLVRLNTDSGTNYSITRLRGDGSSASSSRTTSANGFEYLLAALASVSVSVMNLFSYANPSVYKTALFRYSGATDAVHAGVGLWRSTSAITTIGLSLMGGGNFDTGSTFRLWGIA